MAIATLRDRCHVRLHARITGDPVRTPASDDHVDAGAAEIVEAIDLRGLDFDARDPRDRVAAVEAAYRRLHHEIPRWTRATHTEGFECRPTT